MQLEVIFTFEDAPQRIETYPFVQCVLQNKKPFFEFVTSLLSGKEKESLVKISCCIYYAIGFNPPPNHWYHEHDGKFYFEEIKELMLEIWAIKSTVEPF